jgi:tRNA threonylcarbamoyladenosine biosynthesis protein TsaB
MEPRLLILETSGRIGEVGVAEGPHLVHVRQLDAARRHARDLVPAVAELLAKMGWQPRDLHGVIVSRGPGSYTGLRVGIMSAKTLAYASGCALLAIDTFAAIAARASDAAHVLHVLADAQKDKVYVQRYTRLDSGSDWAAASELSIQPVADWLTRVDENDWISGPGVRLVESRVPGNVQLVPEGQRDATAASLLPIGLVRYRNGERDDFWSVEPLYLRPSAAEEQWQGKSS